MSIVGSVVKNVAKATGKVEKASVKNVAKATGKVSKTEKLLQKGKKELLKGFLKEEFKEWLFSPDESTNTNISEPIDNSLAMVKKRVNTKERADKGVTHWRKDGDIEKASKYRYTIDLDKAIQQDTELQNINERLDSALYAISGNIPNIKVSQKQAKSANGAKHSLTAKKSKTSQGVQNVANVSEESIRSLVKSVNVLNEHLRKSKQTVTEDTAKKLLVSNSKIEVLVKKISDDLVDEQDTRIRPVEQPKQLSDTEKPVEIPRASLKNLVQKSKDSSLFKSILTMGLMGLTGGIIDFISDNFIEDGKFTFNKILPSIEEYFSEKWQGVKDWVSSTFNVDSIIQSVKNWFTSDPVGALGEGFLTSFAGLTGVKLTANAVQTLRASNQCTDKTSKAKTDNIKKPEKISDKKINVKTLNKSGNVSSRLKALKAPKMLKAIPGLGAVFAVNDVISAFKSYANGDKAGAQQHLAEAGVDIIEAIPVIGTAVLATDIASSLFTGNSLAEHALNLIHKDTLALDETESTGIIKKSGIIGKDKIQDKNDLEMFDSEYIKKLIETGDWSDDDLKFLNSLYNNKLKENDIDLEKRRKKVIDKIKDIGEQYHQDRGLLLEMCQNNANLAQVLKDAEQSNDKVGYIKIIAERFGRNVSDIYQRMTYALQIAFKLGHGVNLDDNKIEKLLKIGKYDKKYLDKNQEILKASDEKSKEFQNALNTILDTEKSHENDGADYDYQIRKEMMNNPNFFNNAKGGARSEFDTSSKPKFTGGVVENYKGTFKTVGGDAIQLSDNVKGPYAQKYSKIRGLRNNNPGNIRISNVKWEGKVPREKNTDGSFEQFCAPEFGIRALAMNAKNYQLKGNLWTPRAMIWKWAPPNENNSDKYVNDVIRVFHQSTYEKARNMTADTSFTMSDPELAYCMVCGIILKECGVNPYPEPLIKRAINSALGKESLLTKTQENVTMSVNTDMSQSVSIPTMNIDDNAGPEGKSTNFSLMSSSSTIPNTANGIASDYLSKAVALAGNAQGYSQSNRLGEGSYDCSSFVSRTLQQCGINISPATTTHTMRKTLTSLGFSYTPVSDIQGDYSMLQPGDILLNDRNQGHNHTEFYMGDSWSVGAHSSKNGVSARPNNIDVYHYNGYLRHTGNVKNTDQTPEVKIPFVNPVKDTTASDRAVAQSSEGIANAMTATNSSRNVNISTHLTSVQPKEQEIDISSENMFDANIVNTDMTAMNFAFNPSLGY